MDVKYMRDAIASVYAGQNWKEKCKWMDEKQVIAIYYKFKEQGKFDKPKNKVTKVPVVEEKVVQISLWDICFEKGINFHY